MFGNAAGWHVIRMQRHANYHSLHVCSNPTGRTSVYRLEVHSFIWIEAAYDIWNAVKVPLTLLHVRMGMGWRPHCGQPNEHFSVTTVRLELLG